MEYRNLIVAPPNPKQSGVGHLHWLLSCMVLLLVAHAASAQFPSGNKSSFQMIYKVNGKCSDTLQYERHPTSYQAKRNSKSRCSLNLGFGKIFHPTQLLVLENEQLFKIVSHHKDMVLDLARKEQEVVSPYGVYRVKLQEKSLLFGKWRTWTYVLTVQGAEAGTIILRFNEVLGIISLQNQDKQKKLIGQMELVKVNGKTLQQFVEESDLR